MHRSSQGLIPQRDTTQRHTHGPRSAIRAMILGCALAALWGCAKVEPASPPPVQTVPITASLVDDTVVFGGSMLLEVDGAGVLVPADAVVKFSGQVGDRRVDAEVGALFTESDKGLELEVIWADFAQTFQIGGPVDFSGSMLVTVTDLGGRLRGQGVLSDVTVRFREALSPSITVPETLEIFCNDLRSFGAQGILRSGEGATNLSLSGRFTPDDGGPVVDVAEVVPVSVGASRQEAVVLWSTALGIKPGVFEGRVQLVNSHSNGIQLESSPKSVTIALLPTEIDGLDPPAGSRGQIVSVLGRGFISNDAAQGQSMFFRLDGAFQTFNGEVQDLSGENALQIAPESVPGHTEASVVLRSETANVGGRVQLVGLTAVPGVFQGTVTPILIDGLTTVAGRPWQGEITIAPTRQHVFVRFLPSFSEALDNFGLRNVEPEIRTRIFDVLRRDYSGVNIEFSDVPPSEFVEYSVIEAGGADPNGAGLFGLDNTAGKDTGNVRLNDIIGGENADSGQLGFYVYGGVFIESFRTFSPSLDPNSAIASPAFDEVMSPFMADLGGQGVVASEWPDGPRRELIADAVHVMGSLIGNTITHEIGHSLGMSFFDEDLVLEDSGRFHNDFDEPGAIMDAGAARPFEERAELEGTPAPFFTRRNRAYLETILPVP